MKTTKPKAPVGQVMPDFRRIPVDRILEPELPVRASMNQAKMDELVESMREVGQIEPITVEQHDAMYTICAGHRRYLAARTLRWETLAALVYPEGKSNALALGLHENICREDLNPAEEALWMAQAREELGLDEEGLCKTFHRSADYIAGRFALLRGDPEIFAALQRKDIRLGVAHELNRIDAEDMRRYYLDCARRGDPPARVVRQWVEDWKSQARLRPNPAADEGGAPASSPGPTNPGLPPGVGQPGAAENQPAALAPFFGCELCGGTRDPHNLVTVTLHRWEWEQIMQSVERAAKGQ